MIYLESMPSKFRQSVLPATQKGDGERLDRALKSADKNQADLARHLGVSPPAVSQWITGRRPIPDDKLVAAARFLKRNAEDISPGIARELSKKYVLSKSPAIRQIRGSSSEPRVVQTPALKAQIRGVAMLTQAGTWQWDDMLPAEGSVPWNRPGCYALRVIGDAMHPRYKSGEYLIIREDSPVDADTDVLVVLKDGTAMIRELASDRDGHVALRNIQGGRTTILRDQVRLIQRVVGRADPSEVLTEDTG